MTSETVTQQSLKGLLSLIDSHVAQLPAAGLILSAANRSFTQAQHQADHESWVLLRAGVAHLYSGAPNNAMGSLTGALSKASLRGSALASGLGLQPPRFEQIKQLQPEQDAHAQAVFFVRRLTEALTVDTTKSRDLIIRALHAQSLPDIDQDDTINKLMRSENIRFFNKLAECHTVNTQKLRDIVDKMPPPRPQSKPHPGSFDL